MEKKKKREERRKKWSVLYVTDPEKELITADALAAGQSCNEYIRAYILGRRIRRGDWRRIVVQQAELHAALERIARRIEDRAIPLDAGRVVLALWALEQQIAGLIPTGSVSECPHAKDACEADLPVREAQAVPAC